MHWTRACVSVSIEHHWPAPVMRIVRRPTPDPHMPQNVSIVNDLKTAAVLAGSAGLLGSVSVPFLLPSILEFVPPEQQTLPLPLPLFCILLVIQFLIVYGLFALAGLRLAR